MMRAALRWLAPPLTVMGLGLGVFSFQKVAVSPRLQARNAELRAELVRVRTRNDHLRARAARLRAERTRLGANLDESLLYARTELGMVRPDEVVYRFGTRPPGGAGTP